MFKSNKNQYKELKAFKLSTIIAIILSAAPATTLAQSDVTIPENSPDVIERTAPKPERPLPPAIPQPEPKPNLQVPNVPRTSECLDTKDRKLSSNQGEVFYVANVEVIGNTVLESEINAEVNKFKRHVATLEDLVCLRSKITNLYLNNGYITSGAFIPNNQDLDDGIVQIQVIEGDISKIAINGLKRLKPGYIRNRLNPATNQPLNRNKLEAALQLLLQNPLIDRVDAELTASNSTGKNILLLKITEADAFLADISADNYRSPSIGESQLATTISHNNTLGFGDRLSASYGITEGLDLYNLSYTVPWNAQDGTFTFSYDNSDSNIVDEEFQDVDIASETESFSLGVRQPVIKSPNTELALGLDLDLRRRQTFLDGDPFSFTLGLTDGISNATVLRFYQEWVNRQPTKVFAARSQFNLGIDAFDATINSSGADGEFLAWQGQFQWVQQLSPEILLVTKLGSQFTLDSLLSFEKFSLGGVNTVRGYAENRLVSDNGVLSSIELRLPVTSDSQKLQLTPFFDLGTAWNNEEPNADLATLTSLGLGLRWSVTSNLTTRLNYGLPLTNTDDDGDSFQENGFHWSLNYQPF